jgi:hypothetical protein
MAVKGTRNASKYAPRCAYDVDYFAKKHHLSTRLALHILIKAGPSRSNANAAALRAKIIMRLG